MQEKMDQDKKTEGGLSSKTIAEIVTRERELNKFREQIREQEMQLDEYRVRLKNEQLLREKEIQKELEAREKFFVNREKKLFERQREYEELLTLQKNEAEAFKAKVLQEMESREAEFKKSQEEFALEKSRYNEENRNRIERTSKNYVADALQALQTKETQFHFISKVWSWIGASALVGGLIFLSYITIATFFVLPNPITWTFITFALFKGLIALTLIAALAKYAFLFSNSYMREALKNADRRHAINFGKFYLESYGAAADWTQIKEAFANWNIAGSNAFSEPAENEVNISSLEKVATVVERISKSLSPLAKND